MAEKYNANCSICGRPYYKCISCRDTMTLNPWKAFCDTAEHYKVHQIIRGFNGGIYTKDEARDKLNNIDISDINEFKPHIKQIVDDILKEDKPIVNIVDNVEQKVEIVDDVEPKVESEESEEVEVKIPVYSRKRNYKTEEVEEY